MGPKTMDGDTSTSSDSCNADNLVVPLEFNANLVTKIEDEYEKDENCVDDYLQQMNTNACEGEHYPKDFTNDEVPNGNAVKKDETESEDDEQPVSHNTTPHGDSLLNSCILDEILSEKKRNTAAAEKWETKRYEFKDLMLNCVDGCKPSRQNNTPEVMTNL